MLWRYTDEHGNTVERKVLPATVIIDRGQGQISVQTRQKGFVLADNLQPLWDAGFKRIQPARADSGYRLVGLVSETEDESKLLIIQTRAQEAIPVPVPQPRTVLLPMEFTARFTTAERRAFDNLSETDDTAYDVRWSIRQAVEIDLAAETTIQGVGYLTSKGVLTEARMAEVMAPVME